MFSNLAKVTQTSKYKAEISIQAIRYCSQGLDPKYAHARAHTHIYTNTLMS